MSGFANLRTPLLALSRFRGRGLGEGLLLGRGPFEQYGEDSLQNAIAILDHLAVPKSEHAIALAFQENSARRIGVGAMLAAIQFDDQPSLDADEIGDVPAADRMLLAKFEAGETAIAHGQPDDLFDICPFASQTGGMTADLATDRVRRIK